ncbi:MAG: DNA-binding protein [Verrucomicrobiota bacterium JB022]|nr:DNA-binding protein [Verrucomicrobiota bacterium JB022]
MRYQKLDTTGDTTYVLVFETGEAVMEKLAAFVAKEGIVSARFHGIGAFSEAGLRFFNTDHLEYIDIPVHEQVELLSLTGTIASRDGKAQLHAHAILGKPDGQCIGGHLKDAVVRPTLEVMVIASPAHLHREFDPRVELPLLQLDASKQQEV